MFPSVPPVVRKRAKELMDEIRAAKQTITSGPDNDAMEVEQPEPPTSEEKAETSAQSSITRKFYSTPLVPYLRRENTASPSHLSLFGATSTVMRAKPLSRAMSATRSQLLGKSSSTPKPIPVSYRTRPKLQILCLSTYPAFAPGLDCVPRHRRPNPPKSRDHALNTTEPSGPRLCLRHATKSGAL